MPDALLDRDAELAALERQLAAVRAGSGRVIVVEGPAGIGKSSLLAAVAGGAEAGGVAVLRARGGPLEYDAAWGIARELFAPLRASAAWSELAVGAAALARRALDADADAEPANAGDAMHAAAHGLTWLASNLADRSPALLVVDDVHWADAPSLRWLAQLARRLDGLALGLLCAIRAGEPAAAPDLLAELLAAAPEPPLRPRPLGPAAAEALVRGAAARRRGDVRARLPRGHRRQPVPARRPARAPRRRGRRADAGGRGAVERVRARAGRPQRRAPARPATQRRRRARPRVRRARPAGAAPARVPARRDRPGDRREAGRPAARHRAARRRPRSAGARAPADRERARREPATRGALALARPSGAAARARAR